jgi:hypothetical protein
VYTKIYFSESNKRLQKNLSFQRTKTSTKSVNRKFHSNQRREHGACTELIEVCANEICGWFSWCLFCLLFRQTKSDKVNGKENASEINKPPITKRIHENLLKATKPSS